MITENKKIMVTISPLGIPKIEAQNFHGVGCEAATKPLEQGLAGGSGVDRVMKPEWYETEGQEEKLHW